MKKYFIILILAIVVSINPMYADGVFKNGNQVGYQGHYYKGIYVPGILDTAIVDTLREVKYTIPAKYDKIQYVGLITNNEYVIAESKGKKCFYKNGKIQASLGAYDDLKLGKEYPYTYVMARKGNKYGAIYPKLPVTFDSVKFEKSFVITTKNNKSGAFWNHNNTLERILPEEYDDIKAEEFNLIVTKNNKLGLFSPGFNWLLPIEYNSIDLKTGIVVKNGLYGKYVDSMRSRILDENYQSIRKISDDNNLYEIKMNNKVGLAEIYESTGQIDYIIPIDYDEIDVENLNVKKGNLYGKYNRAGKLILPIEYEEITMIDSCPGHYKEYWVKKSGKTGVIRTDSNNDNLKLRVPLQ